MTPAAPHVKHSVALVIRDAAHPGQIVLVQRPDDDEDLPGVWGLPAATLAPGEDWRAATLRAAREKLALDVAIDGVLNSGAHERAHYTLGMQLVGVHIVGGNPDVERGTAPHGTTRYQAWRWGSAMDVRPAAERGSLCSRLLLEASGGA